MSSGPSQGLSVFPLNGIIPSAEVVYVPAWTCACKATTPGSQDARTKNKSWAEHAQRRLNNKTRLFISANDFSVGWIFFLKVVLKLEVINTLSICLRAYRDSPTQSKEAIEREEVEGEFPEQQVVTARVLRKPLPSAPYVYIIWPTTETQLMKILFLRRAFWVTADGERKLMQSICGRK